MKIELQRAVAKAARNMKPKQEPTELSGFCAGCKKFKQIFRVAESRYRCFKCLKAELERLKIRDITQPEQRGRP